MVQALLKHDVARLPATSIRNDTFLERVFLTWVYAVVWQGMRGTAKQDDLKMPGDQVGWAG